MPIDCFLDTNVLVYGAAGRQDESRKAAIARQLVATQTFGVSAQTLAEFYNTVSREVLVPLSLAEIDAWIERLSSFPFTPVDTNIVRAGIFLSRRYRIGYYDAALLAAAERLGAPIFYSEDLGHNQVYGSVRVVNPFR
ncbi:MAG: PIN domain-containing protein [Bauldia sp.]